MILGVAQAFNPLYFYREIPYGSSGEVFINYKRGGTIVYSKIVNKGSNGIISEFSPKDLGTFDYYNKKLTFHSNSCTNTNGCELYIGIFVNDYLIEDPGEFSIFLIHR